LEKVKRTHIAVTANIQETAPHAKKPESRPFSSKGAPTFQIVCPYRKVFVRP
jgi:hypothetical protein